MIYENLSYNASFKDENKINISFIEGAKVEINGSTNKKYLIKFFNHKTNELIWEDSISTNMWTSPNIQYFIKWRIEVWCENAKIKEHIFMKNHQKRRN